MTEPQLKKVQSELSFTQKKLTRFEGEKLKFVKPNLANATLAFAIDQLGEVREKMSNLKKEEGLWSDLIEGMMRADKAEGEENG